MSFIKKSFIKEQPLVISLALVISSIILILGVALAIAGNTTTKTTSEYPVAGQTISGCTEEILLNGGFIREETTQTTKDNGDVKGDFKSVNHNVTGVGQSTGTAYKIERNAHSSFTIDANSPAHSTYLTFISRSISKDPNIPDGFIKTIYRLRVNNKGKVTADVDKTKSGCK